MFATSQMANGPVPVGHTFLLNWYRVMTASLVQALTLGNILSFGLFADKLAETLGIHVDDVGVIGEEQYLVFLLTGVIVALLHHLLEDLTVTDPQKRDRFIGICGALLWAAGYGSSVALTENYLAFGWVLITCGSIGAGLLYWNTWIMLPSWIPPKTAPYFFPLAIMSMSVAPNAYVFFFSFLLIGIDQRCVPMNQRWYCTYIIMAPTWGVILLVCGACLVSMSPSAATIIKPKSKVQKHPGIYVFFLFIVAMFQALYYIPYINLPEYVSLPVQSTNPLDDDDDYAQYGLGGTDMDVTGVMSTLSGGAIAGKLLCGLFSILLSKTRWNPIQFTVFQCMGWSTLLLIMTSVWIVCTNIPGITAFAFFFGLGIGGFMFGAHLILFHSESEWINFTVTDRVANIAMAQTLGQFLTFNLAYWNVASTRPNYIYVAIALSTAIWIAYARLLFEMFFSQENTNR